MELSYISKKMILVICAALALIIAAGAVYYRSAECLPFALGAALGAGVNVVKIIMLRRAVDKVAEKGENGKNYMTLQYIIRFALTGLVLVVSAVVPFISLYGTAAGILTWQAATLSMRFFVDKAPLET